jgi:superfamily I DNA/RNA helicase
MRRWLSPVPGPAKTRAITYRVAYLIEQGCFTASEFFLQPSQTVPLREMLRRVENLTGSQNVHRVWGGTFIESQISSCGDTQFR